MTPQEVFNKVVCHLREQGTPAKDEKTMTCFYRSPKGLKCAVGCLIPDDAYVIEMEGSVIEMEGSISSLIDKLGQFDPFWKENFPFDQDKHPALLEMLKEHKTLLRQLQSIHDHHHPTEWEYQFTLVANEHDLEIPTVKGAS